jgi:hypothetical protein
MISTKLNLVQAKTIENLRFGLRATRVRAGIIVATAAGGLLFWVSDEPKILSVLAAAVFIFVLLAVMIDWTRQLSQARPDEDGSIVSWLGWQLCSLMPALLLSTAAGIAKRLNSNYEQITSSLPLTLALQVLAAVGFPFLVIAAGRLTSPKTMPAKAIFAFWRHDWFWLILVYFLILLPSLLAWYAVQNTVEFKLSFVWMIIDSAINALTTLVTIAYSVAAYQMVTPSSQLPSSTAMG